MPDARPNSALATQGPIHAWGHVGSLRDYASLLREITDSAFNEGEHAA